ncbi:MAG: hypothetical protein HYZ57_20750 [Acidobacteria bacterium]|nr:hypothetical protein [Acidobacteriota bacterium]MBI3282256.1 hypothetical protein [Acidobacteriota bacterium]
MRFKHILRLCIFVTAAGVLSPASAQVAPQVLGETSPLAELTGNRFYGTWWLSFGPPPQRPLILTMTRSGAFILEDSVDGGGHTPTGASFSLIQGSWARSGPRSAQALGLRFVYDADRKTRAVERVRLSLAFGTGFDRIQGELQFEEMGCTEETPPLPFTVPVCPDPTTAQTQVQRGPAPFTAIRVPIQAPLN